MKKKKVLVHGTADSLQKFFADTVSRDFEIVDLLSDENISSGLEVIAPKNLPKFNYELVDGIIFTGQDKLSAGFFLEQGIEPRKIILWDAAQGWEMFDLKEEDGTQVIYFCGLEFHIRNDSDAKFFYQTYNRLQTQRQIKNLNPQLYPAVLENSFQQRIGRPLDLNNPKTFTEKLQWLKLFDSTPLKSRLADKFAVRSWVAEKIGDEYLIPLLGVWENFDDINFDDLPDKFVLKCNHGCNMNIIVRDKSSFDMQNAREKLNAWLAFDYSAQPLLELHYTRIDRKIIAEKFLSDGNASDIDDYKFWCFDGRVECIHFVRERSTNHFLNFYDANWDSLPFCISQYNPDEKVAEKPEALDKMLNIAETLSAGFNFVRVDLYYVEGKIYFGEMTFIPFAGYITWKPEDIDYKLGSLIRL